VTPEDIGLYYEDVFFDTEDGEHINAWFVPGTAGAPTILFCHGNAGNIGDRLEKISALHSLGLNIFIFDYRGYGASSGRPSEKGVYSDALAAFDYLQGREDINNKKIIAYGVSLGGAVAVDLASKRPVAALILDSTFSSGADMGKIIAPFVPSIFFSVKFASIEKIKDVLVPKLFFHSLQDEMVPYELGKKLFSQAPEPKSFVTVEGLHNDVFASSRMNYLQNVDDFLKNLGVK
jgi:fermentation-respiration switch protein FrsA (DUF1100 family)